MAARISLRPEVLAASLRKSRRSQNAWAQRLGISKAYLSQLVNGHRKCPSAALRRRLLQELGLSFEQLFTYEEISQPETGLPPGSLGSQSAAPHRKDRIDQDGGRLQHRDRPKRRYRPTGDSIMESVLRDLRMSLRQARRQPAFAAFVVAILSLGIGANIAIFTLVHGVLLKPLDFPQAHQLALLVEISPSEGWGRSMVSPANWRDWQRSASSFAQIAAYTQQDVNLLSDEQAQRVPAAAASESLFSTLGVAPAMGRTFRDSEMHPGSDAVVVISHRFWQRQLGAEQGALGSTLQLDGREHRIVGVMPPGFAFPSERVELWKPLALGPREAAERDGRWLSVVGRLAPQTSPEQASEELAALAEALAQTYPETNARWGASVLPLQQAYVGPAKTPLLLLWATTGLVLLVACINVAQLLLARGAARRRELAVRSALGAPRGRLVRQLLTEALSLSLMAAGLGFLLAHWVVELVLRLGASSLPRAGAVQLDGRVLLFGIGLALVVALLFGTAPALRTATARLGPGNRATTSRLANRWRHAMVAGEVAVAVVVLIAAGLLVRSLMAVLDVDPGFQAQHLLSVRLEPPIETSAEGDDLLAIWDELLAERRTASELYQQLQERIQALPGVRSVAAINRAPLSGSSWFFEYAVGAEARAETAPLAQARVITPGYFATAGVPLLAGRTLDRRDVQGAQQAVVIDEALAREMGSPQQALGQQLRFLGPPPEIEPWTKFTVVGVVGSVIQASLEGSAAPTAYFHLPQAVSGHFEDWGMTIMVRTDGEPTSLVPAVRREAAIVAPQLPVFSARSMEEVVQAATGGRRLQTTLLASFAALSLILAVLGIYSVTALTVRQRRQEIGVRIALGARGEQVAGELLRDALRPTLLGLAIGATTAYGLSQVFASMLYGVMPGDPKSYIAGALVPALAAAIACWLPARRATRVDPVRALAADP